MKTRQLAKFVKYLLLVALSLAGAMPIVAEEKPVDGGRPLAVVRVNATTQAHDFFRPWGKKPPVSRRALGAVLSENRVLVAAELVANQNYVELEKAASGEKVAATVAAVDYEANLAVLIPTNPKFLEGLGQLDLSGPVKTGDHVDIWQLESSGTLVATEGLVTTTEVGRYVLDDYGFLLYRVTAAMQYRENSFSVPIVKDGKLAGLLMRFDPRSQSVDAISQPVIEHFLKEAASKTPHGFPRAGLQYQPTRDPQLRRYLKLNGGAGDGGIYLSRVDAGTSAAKAGLQIGDVILEVAGKKIDADGNYDDEDYGKISINHLISTRHYTGDSLKVKFLRGGEIKETTAIAADRPPQSFIIEPYVIDRAPKFVLLGGLIFQELNRQYLREWGNGWPKDAPLRFVYMDRYQAELFGPDRGKIVFLSQVLPAQSAIGYEQLAYLIVDKVNDKAIRGIADLDEALKTPVNGFHKIEFTTDPRAIYLDAATVVRDTQSVQKQYGLPVTSRLTE